MHKSLLGSSALYLAVCTTPVLAQEAGHASPEKNADLSEVAHAIVVTAQKREQSLIEVPQSVSVVDAAMIEKQSVNNIADYLNNVPSLQLVQSIPGQGRLVMRGINTGGVASTVAVYLDETPFGSSSGLANGAALAGDFDPFDIARVEVLRGPQGTLYGASSLGGLVKYVSNAPDTTAIQARARLGIEDTRGGDLSYQGNAMVNVPLGSTLAFRASGSYRKQGGFIDSIGTSGSDIDENINEYRSYGGRASLQWTPTPDLTLRATASLQTIEVDGPSQIEVDPATLKPLYDGLTYSQYIPAFSDVDYRVFNLVGEYDLGFATITSSTSYSEQTQTRRDELSYFINTLIGAVGLPDIGGDVYQAQITNNEKWTQELRLASASNNTIEWLVGGYYTQEDALIDQEIFAVDPGTLDIRPYLPELGGLGGAATASSYEEIAAFGNLTVHLGDRFDIDLGGRYSHNNQTSLNTGFGLLGATETYEGSSEDDVFTFSVAPRIELSDKASIYARVAKGYRPGGPNVVPPGVDNFPATFAPDTVTSYEVGFKGETRNRTLGIEAALYHIDWTDIQLLAVVNNYGANINGASAEVDGAEVSVRVAPVPGFVTTINASYNDARLTADTDPVLLGAVAGDPLPFTPEITVSVNTDYEWSIGGNATASIGGSIRALSSQTGNYDADYLAIYGHFPDIKSYEIVDLRAGIDFESFAIQAYVKNLFDVAGVTSVVPPLSSGVPAYPNGAALTGITRPRTIGLSVTTGF